MGESDTTSYVHEGEVHIDRDAIVKQLGKEVKANKAQLESLKISDVIIFGSVATGQAHEQSDIDVAVIYDPSLFNDPDVVADAGTSFAARQLFFQQVPELINNWAGTNGKKVQGKEGETELLQVSLLSVDDEEGKQAILTNAKSLLHS